MLRLVWWQFVACGPVDPFVRFSGDQLEMKRAHLVVHGRVQGVFFRVYTQREAERLGLSGWVRNRSNGTVEAVVEGPVEAVNALVQWCERGPGMARVHHLDVSEEAPIGLSGGFMVRPTV
jgi:acylphosphatase